MADRIWLVRHGETDWSRTGQHTGRQDLALTALGEQEAYQTKSLLRDVAFEGVYCSPLLRARRTCEICGYLHRARILDDLMEWDYGALSGRTAEQVREEIPGWSIWTGPVPEGETIDQIADRARRALSVIDDEVRGQAVVFSHGHLLRMLTTQWLGLPSASGRHFAMATAAVSVLGYDNGAPAILRWNSK